MENELFKPQNKSMMGLHCIAYVLTSSQQKPYRFITADAARRHHLHASDVDGLTSLDDENIATTGCHAKLL